jgi:repressor LexA
MKANDPKQEQIPLLGQLGAGAGVEFLPTVKFRKTKIPRWARSSDRFVLSEICGDSLIGADIRDGDLALIYLTTDIKPGDLVAVLTPTGLLVKFLSFHGEQVRLQSANPEYPPHDYDPEDVQIQGKVIRTERPT